MDKKDIYEHLAKIYLDASLKRKKKLKRYPHFLSHPAFISGLATFLFLGVFFIFFNGNKHSGLKAETALFLINEPVKINFNFSPAKKETYTINLNKLNFAKFRSLGFSLKKTEYQDNISLRIELVSGFKEASSIYIKELPNKWQEYRINFTDFKDIGEWSEMSGLFFIVEEWNAQGKSGIVYIDNIRLLR